MGTHTDAHKFKDTEKVLICVIVLSCLFLQN